MSDDESDTPTIVIWDISVETIVLPHMWHPITKDTMPPVCPSAEETEQTCTIYIGFYKARFSYLE